MINYSNYYKLKKMNQNSFSEKELNYPFGSYPKFPFSGYHDILTYNYELVRLNNYILNLQKQISESKENILLHITIGTAMEEYLHVKKKSIEYQWKQLIPDHIFNILDQDRKIYHIVISPDCTLAKNTFIKPEFFKYICDDDNIKNVNDREFQYSNLNIAFFCTQMPSEHFEKNNKKIDYLEKNIQGDMNFKQYRQTSNDVDYIKNFYDNLSSLINTVNDNKGLVSCFSFAVFYYNTENSQVRNYQMFPEIKNIFSETKNKSRILAEWIYKEDCYFVIPYNVKNNKKIYYINEYEYDLIFSNDSQYTDFSNLICDNSGFKFTNHQVTAHQSNTSNNLNISNLIDDIIQKTKNNQQFTNEKSYSSSSTTTSNSTNCTVANLTVDITYKLNKDNIKVLFNNNILIFEYFNQKDSYNLFEAICYLLNLKISPLHLRKEVCAKLVDFPKKQIYKYLRNFPNFVKYYENNQNNKSLYENYIELMMYDYNSNEFKKFNNDEIELNIINGGVCELLICSKLFNIKIGIVTDNKIEFFTDSSVEISTPQQIIFFERCNNGYKLLNLLNDNMLIKIINAK